VSTFRDQTRPPAITYLRAQYVLPLAISIATAVGDAAVVIPSNYKLPVFKKITFTTSVEYQSHVVVHLALGNHRRAGDNILRESVVLEGLHPMRQGAARIRVTIVVGESGAATVAVRQTFDDDQSIPKKGLMARIRDIEDEISGSQRISKVVKFPDLIGKLTYDYSKYDVDEEEFSASFLTDGVAGELPEH